MLEIGHTIFQGLWTQCDGFLWGRTTINGLTQLTLLYEKKWIIFGVGLFSSGLCYKNLFTLRIAHWTYQKCTLIHEIDFVWATQQSLELTFCVRNTNFHSIVRLLNIASIKCNVRVAIIMYKSVYHNIGLWKHSSSRDYYYYCCGFFLFSQPGGGTLKVHLYF